MQRIQASVRSGVIYIHIVAVHFYQDQAAVALLIFGTNFAIVGGTPCRFFLVRLLKVVCANYSILRIEREELDAAGRQVELERRQRSYRRHFAEGSEW